MFVLIRILFRRNETKGVQFLLESGLHLFYFCVSRYTECVLKYALKEVLFSSSRYVTVKMVNWKEKLCRNSAMNSERNFFCNFFALNNWREESYVLIEVENASVIPSVYVPFSLAHVMVYFHMYICLSYRYERATSHCPYFSSGIQSWISYVFFLCFVDLRLITFFSNNQLDAQFIFLYLFIPIPYMFRATKCSSIVSTRPSGTCHSMLVMVWYTGLDGVPSKPAYHTFTYIE